MNDFLDKLNENQLKAAKHLTGPMMVLAGPGSGKTAVITSRTAFLVNDNINPQSILVITYSKAAAGEMEKRFKSLMPNNPPVAFGTFHSVFYRMIRRKYNLNIDQIFNDNERKNLIRSFLQEKNYDLEEEFLTSTLNEMSLVRNELHELQYYHSNTIATSDFREICEKYEAYKNEKGKLDFDDMLCKAFVMLKEHKAELNYWQDKYNYIMIDEFQDINRVQYEMVKLLTSNTRNIFIVGDDDQSIYRFRGSRPEFLLNFPSDFPETGKVTLDVNYRSTDEVINYANYLIKNNSLRYDKIIVGTGKTGKKPILYTSEDQNHEAVRIAEQIRKLWKSGVSLDEIVVAFRLNMQARAFMDAFLNLNIPFKSRDEIPTIYEHWIAEDIFAYLRVSVRLGLRQKVGYDADAARIINKPFRFISKAFLQGLKKNDLDLFAYYKRDSSLHIATKNNIEELHDDLKILSKRKTADAIRYIRKGIGYNGHISDICDYKKLNPIGLNEIADELQDAAKQFNDPIEFITHAKNTAKLVKEQGQNGPCCTLTTLHSAKGLEFKHVFIAGVNEEILPSLHSKTKAEIEEERRLFYVGVTRAKEELILSTLKTRYDKPVKPSRFIVKTT